MLAAALAGILILLPRDAAAQNDLDELKTETSPCPTERKHCFGIVVHMGMTGPVKTAESHPAPGVVEDSKVVAGGGRAEGSPVQDVSWLRSQLDKANAIYALVDTGFEVASVVPLTVAGPDIESRSDRDALSRAKRPAGLIHLFVVSRLANVDEEGVIRGVHWRFRKKRSERWIIMSKIAPVAVLAHELGHYFGLSHSAPYESVMNKARDNPTPMAERTFSKKELGRLRRQIARLVKSKALLNRSGDR